MLRESAQHTTAALAASYVLPLRTAAPDPELATYLRSLARLLDDVIVVDASDEPVRQAHRQMWPAAIKQLPVDSDVTFANGKVNGVITGLRHAAHDRVIVADDDVRYSEPELRRALDELEHADAIIPQNYFDPLPWHARWDTARTLLNRAFAHDYPGTLGVRRTVLPGGYDGDVLFENLELLRTVEAAGGRVVHLPDLFVHRVPCGADHFRGQRVRQAYDSFAQPGRLVGELAILPATGWTARRYGLRGVGMLALASVAAAEVGRRRAKGTAVFPASTAWFAPAWLAERGVCAWIAVGARLRGGARYGGRRLRHAANPPHVLRQRWKNTIPQSSSDADRNVQAVLGVVDA